MKQRLKALMPVWFAIALMAVVVLTGCAGFPFPGGSIGFQFQIPGAPPTAKQAKAYRAQNDHVLINGQPVDKAKYPSVVRIFMGNASCTANIVGKRKILTAGHCGNTGDVAQFQTLSGKKYSAVLQQAPGYPDKDLDLNVGTTNVDIDAVPMSVRIDRFERKGLDVVMIGYGCTNPSGNGGNDGILRIGASKVSGGQGYDLVLQSPGGSALCYGDSGGPVFANNDADQLVQIAVNSKGNIKDVSYVTRTTLDEAAAFLSSISGICGASQDCGTGGGNVTPPPPTNPGISVFDDDKVHVEVKLK